MRPTAADTRASDSRPTRPRPRCRTSSGASLRKADVPQADTSVHTLSVRTDDIGVQDSQLRR